jgi:hypothetical protein
MSISGADVKLRVPAAISSPDVGADIARAEIAGAEVIADAAGAAVAGADVVTDAASGVDTSSICMSSGLSSPSSSL